MDKIKCKFTKNSSMNNAGPVITTSPALFVIYYLTFSLIYHIINQSFIKVGI